MAALMLGEGEPNAATAAAYDFAEGPCAGRPPARGIIIGLGMSGVLWAALAMLFFGL